uniref:Sensory neuron membrane protein n=1 Tax=Semiothisa cinerearia TaxID=2249628 RepID=A0A889XL44_9NEOP|nr:sensory neuron membrane protein [Semiothisa cinerearia]
MLASRAKLIFTCSLAFLILAIVLAVWGFPKIVNKQIQKNVQLESSSQMFDKWLKMPMPMDFKVYLFNVTNTDEVNEGEKPKLQEIGPYVYKEYRERTVLSYGANDTVKYMLKKHFEFDPVASGGLTEEDQVTVINFSYLAAVLAVHDMMPPFVPMVNKALEQFFTNLTDPFLRVRVRDLFFDGIFLNCEGDNSALGLVCGQIRAQTPPTMRPADDANGFYFSMFSHMNRSESGPYEMVRGTENIRELGHIVSYKEQPVLPNWGDQYCGMINGSDSSIFPPIDESNVPEKLYSFEPDICRSLYVSSVGKRTMFNMTAYYYEIHESALAAKSANPNNRCFCKKNWSANHDGCLIMGLLNLAPCQGAPAIASLPHYYLASEELLEYFAEGIQPNKSLHNTYVYLDPVTGAVLSGVKRLQFNIELRNIPTVPQLQAVRTGLFPLLWLEEGATIPVSLQDELKAAHRLLSYVEIGRWVLLALGILAALAAGAALAKAANLIPRHNNSVSFILTNGNGHKG